MDYNTQQLLCISGQLLHPFNGLFSRTTWASWHQKGKPFWILLEQEMMGWQWHQLHHMQITCTSLQTDNHASTGTPSFFTTTATAISVLLPLELSTSRRF